MQRATADGQTLAPFQPPTNAEAVQPSKCHVNVIDAEIVSEAARCGGRSGSDKPRRSGTPLITSDTIGRVTYLRELLTHSRTTQAARLQPRPVRSTERRERTVAFADEYLDPGLKPMSEVNDYKIEKGDPDPRGYTVVGSDGRSIGTVDDLIIDTAAMKVRYLVVDVNAGGRASEQPILLPAQDVDVRSDSRQVIARRFTGQERRWTRRAASGREREQTRLTRAEEELEIGKREVERGEARFGKHVETEHVSQPVTKKREEVLVERRPVTAGARADASISEDEVRVPLKEEELVVEKRPVVKEELVVGKREVEERDTVEADLRREEFDLDKESTARPRGPRREDF